MKRHALLSAVTALALATAGAAEAGCYADYKAKRGNPIKLHYGVIELSNDADCGSKGAAKAAIAARIGADGWTLLNVLSLFGPEGLGERKASAGKFFLRY